MGEEKKERKPRVVKSLDERIEELDTKIEKYSKLINKAKEKKELLVFKRDNPSAARKRSISLDMQTIKLIEEKGLNAENIQELIQREYGE
nr:MAG TPA: hypothetical protein [Caudoviricetes sp.]